VRKPIPVVKIRILALTMSFLLAVQFNAHAQGWSAGLYNSLKGMGVSIDYKANDDIYNSFTLLADMTGIFGGRYTEPGIKMVYLHYNRLSAFSTEHADFGIFLAPGASTGLVRDHDTDSFGTILTADIAIALNACFIRNIDIEVGFMAELGFFATSTVSGTQMNIYDNGLRKAMIPSIKLMYRF